METVLRAAAVYFFLLVLVRISGKRTLAEVTTFDFVLLLVVAETTQQALIGEDFSVANSFLLVLTLVGIDIGLSLVQRSAPRVARWIEGVPVLLVDDGRLLTENMRRSRVDASDILEAARRRQGLERLDQIRYAVLERGGGISVIPQRGERER